MDNWMEERLADYGLKDTPTNRAAVEQRQDHIDAISGDRCTCAEQDYSPHVCPFKAEIHDDFETLCTCCPECEGECRMEV